MPVNATTGRELSSTYGACVFVGGVNGTAAVGLPLKPFQPVAASEFVDGVSGSLGLLWLLGGVWVPHFTAMVTEVFDAQVLQGGGYVLAVRGDRRVAYYGI